MQKERENFLNWKMQEMKKFNDVKQDEIRKLRKERRVYERYCKASRTPHPTSENDLIEMLSKKVKH